MKRIYLAGFDVFYPDAVERGVKMKEICARYGLEGCFPLDNECDGAEEIFAGNCAMIDSCSLIVANLNPFRGAEPDSGTCFEVGYAWGRGKKVYGYVEDGRSLRDRLGETDAEGLAVEDFGLPVNLMLACSSVLVEGDFEQAIRRIAADEKLNTGT